MDRLIEEVQSTKTTSFNYEKPFGQDLFTTIVTITLFVIAILSV